jgi:hypothetical protein
MGWVIQQNAQDVALVRTKGRFIRREEIEANRKTVPQLETNRYRQPGKNWQERAGALPVGMAHKIHSSPLPNCAGCQWRIRSSFRQQLNITGFSQRSPCSRRKR